MSSRRLEDADVRGKRVLLREDLNVPMKDGKIADETRIAAALPTLRWLHEHRAKTVILSHFGRPDGKPNPKYSLRPIAARLARAARDGGALRRGLRRRALPSWRRARCRTAVSRSSRTCGSTRRRKRTIPGSRASSRQSGDLYVNDAFGTAHRAHASTAGVAADLPSYAGFLMQAELEALGRLTGTRHVRTCARSAARRSPTRSACSRTCSKTVDAFVIGGGMANTFLAAQGVDVGSSLRDPDLVPAQRIIALAHDAGVALHLPTDAVIADAFDADGTARTVALDERRRRDDPRHRSGDRAGIRRGAAGAKTIVFNGPMGVYEKPPYRNGTRVVGEAIAEATRTARSASSAAATRPPRRTSSASPMR